MDSHKNLIDDTKEQLCCNLVNNIVNLLLLLFFVLPMLCVVYEYVV